VKSKFWALVPAKVIVELFGVKVPEFVKSPLTLNEAELPVILPVELIVTFPVNITEEEFPFNVPLLVSVELSVKL